MDTNRYRHLSAEERAVVMMARQEGESVRCVARGITVTRYSLHQKVLPFVRPHLRAAALAETDSKPKRTRALTLRGAT